jgi:hypothetical protein
MDPREAVSSTFRNVLDQLVGTLADAYPERFGTSKLQLSSQTNNVAMIGSFCDTYSHLFERASRHDISIFDDPTLVQYKDLAKDGASADTLTVFWQYIDHLVRFGTIYKMYHGVPTGVMNVISESISSVKSKLDSGALDMKFLNPLELGQDVLSKLSPSDIEGLTAAVMSNQDQVMSMMSTMMSMMNQNK